MEKPDHYLVRELQPLFGGQGSSDPNKMAIDFASGNFSLFDYAEMNIGMGYSVEGFLELHNFFELSVACDDPALCREGRRFEEKDFLPLDGRERRLSEEGPKVGEIWRHVVKGDDYLIYERIYPSHAGIFDISRSVP